MKDYNDVPWKDLVYYDETSPTFLRWNVASRNGQIKVNDKAGSIWSNGYSSLRYNYASYLCHRIVWILHKGEILGDSVIDHIDGNSLNNSIENLRLVSKRGNCQNQKLSSKNSSGIIGVYFQGIDKECVVAQWQCQLTGKRKRKCFSVVKYGEQMALKLAIDYRNKKIEEQISLGAEYTDRHGTK